MQAAQGTAVTPPPTQVIVGQSPSGPVIATVGGPPGATPSQVLDGFRQQRSELRNQLERLEDQRENLSQELQDPQVSGADKKGLEARILNIDARIAAIDKALADADANVARAAAVPGAVQPPPPPPPRRGPPEEFFILFAILTMVFAVPFSIAYARRIWRKGAQVVSAIPQEIYDRFNRIDQAIDAVAVEVERIGEGQRYITRLYADQQRALDAGPAEPVAAADRESEKSRR